MDIVKLMGKNRIPNDVFIKWFKNKFPNYYLDKIIYPQNFFKKFNMYRNIYKKKNS